MSPRGGARPPRRWFPALCVLCIAVGGLWPAATEARPVDQQVVVAPAALAVRQAEAGLEAQFVSAINGLRASKGLRQLTVSGELTGVARGWTDQMVQAGQISHNPALGTSVSGAWTKLGENVGVGYGVDELMQAFINSPHHYTNLVDPDWNQVGVGVTLASDGRIYTTHNFMARGGSAATPAVPAAATSAPSQPSSPTTQPSPAPPPPPPPPPEPHPTAVRVTAVLDPLRSLESA